MYLHFDTLNYNQRRHLHLNKWQNCTNSTLKSKVSNHKSNVIISRQLCSQTLVAAEWRGSTDPPRYWSIGSDPGSSITANLDRTHSWIKTVYRISGEILWRTRASLMQSANPLIGLLCNTNWGHARTRWVFNTGLVTSVNKFKTWDLILAAFDVFFFPGLFFIFNVPPSPPLNLTLQRPSSS